MWGSERCSSFLLFMAEGGILPRFVTEDEAEKEENGGAEWLRLFILHVWTFFTTYFATYGQLPV